MHADITDQKLAAETLRRTTELLQAVVAGTPDCVFVKDREGRYLLCNEAFARFVGRTVDQMIGMTNAQIFDAQMALALIGTDLRVLEAGDIVSSEDLLPGIDGEHTFITTKAPYRDAQGRIIGVFGILHDISHRKRIETAHAHQRRILRTLVDALPDVIYTKDAGGPLRRQQSRGPIPLRPARRAGTRGPDGLRTACAPRRRRARTRATWTCSAAARSSTSRSRAPTRWATHSGA